MRRRWIAVLVALALVLGGVFVGGPSGSDPSEPPADAPHTELRNPRVDGALQGGPSGSDPSEPPRTSENVQRYMDVAAEIRSACGVPVHVACQGDVCVAGATTTPGWRGMLERPRVTAEVAAVQFLGLPQEAMPCMTASAEVPLKNQYVEIDLDDGSTHRCYGISDGDRATFRALCDRTLEATH